MPRDVHTTQRRRTTALASVAGCFSGKCFPVNRSWAVAVGVAAAASFNEDMHGFLDKCMVLFLATMHSVGNVRIVHSFFDKVKPDFYVPFERAAYCGERCHHGIILVHASHPAVILVVHLEPLYVLALSSRFAGANKISIVNF